MTASAHRGGWIYHHQKTIGIGSGTEIGMKDVSIAVVVGSGGAGETGDSGAGAFKIGIEFRKGLDYTCHETWRSSRRSVTITELEADGVCVDIERDTARYTNANHFSTRSLKHLFYFAVLQIHENMTPVSRVDE